MTYESISKLPGFGTRWLRFAILCIAYTAKTVDFPANLNTKPGQSLSILHFPPPTACETKSYEHTFVLHRFYTPNTLDKTPSPDAVTKS